MERSDWSALQRRFLAALADDRSSWIDVWGLLAEATCLERALQAIARHTAPLSLSHDAPLIADVVQMVVLDLARRIQKRPSLGFDPGRGGFKVWLEQILANACRDCWRLQVRQRRRERPLPYDLSERTVRDRTAAALRESAWHALDQLPPVDGQVLKLFAAGTSLVETARKLNMTVYTVRRARERGLKRLRECLIAD